MVEVYDALAKARGAGRRVALVTVLGVEGEAPSHPGAKLVVDEAGDIVAGTLGCSEFDAAGVELAHEALDADTPRRASRSFGSGAEARSLELFAEVHDPEPAVVVLGAGAVGRAIVDLARFVGRRAILVAPGGSVGVASGVEVRADDPVRYLLAAPPGPDDAVVLSDHESPWVDDVLRIALASSAFYVGMLGSRRHAPGAVRRLRDAGVPAAHIRRLRSPVGLDIGSRTPGEIALSIVAEIVAVEREHSGGPMRLDWVPDA